MIKDQIKELIKHQVNFEIVKENELVLVFRFMFGEYRIMHNGYVINGYKPEVLITIIDKPKLIIKQVRQIALFDPVIF